MANKWQYPRWRRATMQAVMWIVFGASLGLAALMSRRADYGATMPLGDPRSVGPLSVRFPANWQIVTDPRADSVNAIEPNNGQYPRTVRVRVGRVPNLMSPEEFLSRAHLPDKLEDADGYPGVDNHHLVTDVAGRSGIVTGGALQPVILLEGAVPTPVPRRAFFATTVLPNRVAILVTIEGRGPVDLSDIDILRRVAGAIDPGDTGTTTSAVTSDGSLVLPNGTRMTMPSGYTVSEESDRNRLSRTLTSTLSNSSIELVPCFVTPNDSVDDRVTMAALREPLFHAGSIATVPSTSFQQIRPPKGLTPAYPTGAYLATDGSGAALLAIVRADKPSGGPALDAAWRVITNTLSFNAPPNIADMVRAGENAVQALTTEQIETALDKSVGQQWMLWYRDTENRAAGWSTLSLALADDGRWHGVSRFRQREGRSVRKFVDDWEMDFRSNAYRRATAIEDQLTTNVPPRQVLTVRGNSLTLTTDTENVRNAKLTRGVPKNFLPGPVLSAVLGTMTIDSPIILKTDCFPGVEPATKIGLLNVLIEPGDDSRVDETRAADDGSGPLRHLRITVAGTGDVSHWYFHADGQLAQIDLADGMHRRPAEISEIALAFSEDETMTP